MKFFAGLSTRARKIIGDIIIASALLTLFGLGLLSYFDTRLQDFLVQRGGLPYPNIIVIGMDEAAIEMFNATPDRWPRNIMARAINILNACKYSRPAVIALDILYTGEHGDYDDDLANAARDGGNVVVAASAITGWRQSEINSGKAIYTLTGFERPFDALSQYASYGIVNAIHDDDARIRSTRLFYELDSVVYRSFAYEIYRKYYGLTDYDESWFGNNEKYIIYHGSPGTFMQFSFADIFDDYFIEDFVESGFFEGTVVMIGAFAPGLGDDFYVPGHGSRMYGVEIHANILQTLIDENFIEKAPDFINWLVLIFVIAIALVLANKLEIKRLIAAYIALIGLFVGSLFVIFHFGYVISIVYVLVSFPIIYVYQLLYSYIIESIERRKAQLIAEKHQILVDSINYASVIQRGILPHDNLFEKAFADYSVKWDPRDTVGGDIYWIKNFEKGSLLAVCDCTGHGVPGALLTALVVSSFEEIVNEETCSDTAEILYQLDQKLTRIFEVETKKDKTKVHIKNGCDLAVLFIDKCGEVSISSGNTNVFICDGKEITRVKGQRIYVGEGKIKGREGVKVHTIPANPENKYYIASDGMYDQIGGTHSHSFGYTIFKNLILEHHSETQAAISAKIWDVYEEYRGNHMRLDDFVLVTFRAKS